MSKGISVDNFDVVKKHLRDELKILGSKLEKSILTMRSSENVVATDLIKLEQMKDMVETLMKMYDSFAKNMELKPVINVTTPEVNIPEIKLPTINVPEIRMPEINIPAPEVTVNNDFFEITQAIRGLVPYLENLDKITNDPNNPISVRMSNGKEFIDTLKEISESGRQMVAVATGGGGYTTVDNTAQNPAKVAIYDASGNQITSFGGGTQYTEGDVDASITGTAAMMEGAGNTLLPLQGTVADGLLVNLGSNNDVTVTGTVTVDTELPTAGALADTTSNPTTTVVGSMNELFNGTTWDRARTAYADSQPVTGIQAAGNMIYNGTTWDRAKSPTADSVAATGLAASALMGYDGASWNRIRAALGDGVSATGILASTTNLYNGTTYDRMRSASGDSLTTGLAAAGNMLWDGSSSWNRWRNAATDAITTAGVPYVSLAVYSGSSFSKQRAATADGLSTSNISLMCAGINNGTTIDRWKNPTGDAAAVTGYGGVIPIGYNGSTFDRVRSGPAADSLSTTGYLGVTNLAWNNTSWDRVRIPSGDGMAVTGFLGNVLMFYNGSTFDRGRSIVNATDSTGTGIQASGILGQYDDTSPGTVTENRFGNIRMSVRREVYTQIRDAAGGERGTNVNSSNQLSVNAGAFTSGGASYFKSIDLDETEEQVKAAAGQLYGGVVMNLTASVLYFKVYNATAASVIVGTTVPDLTIPIPTAGSTNGAGFTLPIPATGLEFSTAITVACTTGIADNDSGAPAANACAVALFYK